MSESDTSAVTPTTLGPSRMNLFVAGIMLMMSIFFIAYAPQYLFWLPLLPIIFIVWTLRSKTIVNQEGIGAQYLIKHKEFMPWEKFSGIGFKKSGRGYAVSTSDNSDDMFLLPGVSFNSLITLHRAAPRYISDPVTEGIIAKDNQVKIIDQDGYSVMVSPEQHELWLKEQELKRHSVQAEVAEKQPE